ncbi:MAG: bifunctional DNA primase/polymerase [Gemmatimonadetes bacterium]|nr:bifunctional DNA primase/polymerase [Gemmatimonadota bacterium]
MGTPNLPPDNSESHALLIAALSYAKAGWRVFPLTPGQKQPPLVPDWPNLATTDERQIRTWWADHPRANIGIATGAASNLFVLDVDGPQGERSLAARFSDLPPTREVKTPRPGRHLYFCDPPPDVASSVGKLGPRLDTRVNGGYVVAPPSVVNGNAYTWTNPDASLRRVPPALLPSPVTQPTAISEGQRNSKLFHLASRLRGIGLGDEALREAIKAENQRCDPPLPEEELEETIFRSVLRYPEGAPAPTSTLAITAFADIEPEVVRWLWPKVIPYGKLTLLIGDPGQGKSFLTVDLAARVSVGGTLPDGSTVDAADVLLVFCEDGAGDTVKPRLKAAGADERRVHEVTVTGRDGAPRLLVVPDDLPPLQVVIEKTGARLVVLDPISAFLGEKVDSWKDDQVRRALVPISHLAEATGAAIVAILHLNKKSSANAVHRAMGSVAFTGVARSVFMAGPHPEDKELELRDQRKVFAPVKMNLTQAPRSRVFRIVEAEGVARVLWEDETRHSAEDVLTSQMGVQATPEGALETALQFLRETLAGGPRPAKEIFDLAKGQEISDVTLRRAADRGVIKRQEKDVTGKRCWTWALSDVKENF